MAMRPRGGGRSNAPRGGARPRSGGGVWPVYEDFRPVSEWQQDDEFHTLNIFLPGFTKEQIRVSTEDKNIIRVRGERLVAGNKWSRFQEDFQVPENGEINSVRAKYQGGTLSITVPKKKPDKPKSTDIEKQPATQKGKDKISEAGTSQMRDDKTLEPQKISSDPRKEQGLDEEKKTREDQGEAHRAAEISKSTETKSSEAKKTYNEPIIDHPLSEGKGERRRSIAPLGDIGLEADKIASIGLKEKKISSEKPDEANKRRDDENSSKSLPDAAAAAAKKMKPHDEDRATGDNKGSNGKQITPSHGVDYEASKMQKLMKMKGIAELNEERQLLVNMGVAVLIIMGLSAYVTYKFVTGKERN